MLHSRAGFLTCVAPLGFTLADQAEPGPRLASAKPAFTLAETLITLGIIGVVAALTMPALVNDIQKRDWQVKLKKQYSVLSQAVPLLELDDGEAQSSFSYAGTEFKDKFIRYFKVANACENLDCVPAQFYKNFAGTNVATTSISNKGQFITTDGTIYMFFYGNPSNYIYVVTDINGFKKPNIFGHDVFAFIISPTGVFRAFGGAELSTNCASTTATPFLYGLLCTLEALSNENYFKELP